MFPSDKTDGAIRVAIVNDCEVVVEGVAAMLSRYPGRIQVVEISAGQEIHTEPVDLILYDAYASIESHADLIPELLGQSGAQVAVYSWHRDPELVAEARRYGAAGYLSKEMSADELVESIEAIDAGEMLSPHAPVVGPPAQGDWPGRGLGLSARESEVLALIAHGLTNEDIADVLYLSINTVKTYVRTVYRKVGIERRSQAVLWAIQNGITPRDASATDASLM